MSSASLNKTFSSLFYCITGTSFRCRSTWRVSRVGLPSTPLTGTPWTWAPSGISSVNMESLMSCHLLLNLLHELANMILCEALPSIISFLPTNVINLVINDNEFEILFIT